MPKTKIDCIDETRTMNCGLKSTIIKYNGTDDITIQFETGEIVQHRTYDSFKKGQISPLKNHSQTTLNNNAQNRIGETNIMTCGLTATIIEYNRENDITIQFETGEIVQHRRYDNFRKGKILPSNCNYNQTKLNHHAQEKIGKTNIMNCGLKATIIEYNGAMDITVQFETGIIVQHRQYNGFKKGTISPSKIINDISIEQFVTVKDNKWYYVCKHPKWNKPRILSVPEIYAYDISKDKTITK